MRLSNSNGDTRTFSPCGNRSSSTAGSPQRSTVATRTLRSENTHRPTRWARHTMFLDRWPACGRNARGCGCDPHRAQGAWHLQSQDGQRFHVTGPMTDAEVAAYAEHPDTFFGAVKPQGKANGPLELFDFFFESYGNLPKERLLELLAAAKTPDLEDLAKLSREDLADTYCERMVYGAMAQTSARQTP